MSARFPVAVTSQAFRNYSFSLVNFFDGFTGSFRLGTLLFSYGFLTYVAIILAVAIWFFLTKTRTGLSPARHRRKYRHG